MTQQVCMLVTTDVINDPRVMRAATALLQNGYQVTALGLKQTETELDREVVDGLTIYRLQLPHQRLSRWLKRRRGLQDKQSVFVAKELPMEVAQRNWRQWLAGVLVDIAAFLHFLGVFVTFGWFAARLKADVYHAHDVNTLLPALWARRGRSVPVIYDSHEYWYEKAHDRPLTRWLIRATERWCVPQCTHTIASSQSIAQGLCDVCKISRNSTTVVMNVPTAIPAQTPPPIHPNEPIRILYHGVYVPMRRLDTLIDVVNQIHSPVHLTLRGFGPLEAQLRQQVERLGAQTKVTFAPPVPMKELTQAAVGEHIGVLIVAEQSARLHLANKIFEYMAAGLALLTSDLIEQRRIVMGHQIGVVCDDRDPQAVLAALKDLMSDRVRLDDYRQRAWQVYRQQYNWQEHQKVLLQVYADALRH